MRLAKWEPFKSTLARWDPAREFEEMADRLTRFIDRNPAEEALVTAAWSPMVDIEETDKEYLIKAELPEVKKEDVKVTVKDGVLSLEGERQQEKEEKNKKFHRVERSYGKFVRCFTMPEDANAQGVRADFKDGVLNVHLVKSPSPKPKGVEVTVN
jgi:HSP20 family protein